MQDAAFVEARREIHGLTAGVEKRALHWIAARLPRSVQPDHLTALGLVSMLGAGVAYALTPRDLRWLHAVNLSLLLNWFGDSLDGTVARVRGTTRPRYGFYVDHLVDAFGAVFLFVGLAFSGLIHPAVAASLLVAYLLMTNEIALAAHATGRFRISLGPVGGTELRILLALVNLVVLGWPSLNAFGRDVRVLDALGIPAILGLVAIVVANGIRNAVSLDRLERGGAKLVAACLALALSLGIAPAALTADRGWEKLRSLERGTSLRVIDERNRRIEGRLVRADEYQIVLMNFIGTGIPADVQKHLLDAAEQAGSRVLHRLWGQGSGALQPAASSTSGLPSAVLRPRRGSAPEGSSVPFPK